MIVSLTNEHFLQSCLGLREVSCMSHFAVGLFTWTLIRMRYQLFSELHFLYPTKPYIPINAAMTNRIPSFSILMLTQLDHVKGHIWGPISRWQWHERTFISNIKNWSSYVFVRTWPLLAFSLAQTQCKAKLPQRAGDRDGIWQPLLLHLDFLASSAVQ